MRTGSSTLLAEQKKMEYDALCKIVLTKGANTYTYTVTRIIRVEHTEGDDAHSAIVTLDNSDNVLTALALEGYKAVVSNGATTSAGDEYLATAELYVISQQLHSWEDRLLCSLSLAGVFNLMAKDQASEEYTLEDDDTQTVKDLIRKICGDTGVTILACFNQCESFDIVFDSEDALIDVFQPKDSFRISRKDGRLSKLNNLLSYTNCVKRFDNDGKIHIFVPELTTAEEEYKLDDASYHSFFGETYRKVVVIPNYVEVKSHPSHDESYTGYAKTDDYDDLTDIMKKTEYYFLRVASNQQCTDIATALLAHAKADCEKGSGYVPINFAAEIHDFIKVTDSRIDTYREGNIGYIKRVYEATIPGQRGKFTMEFRFGKALAGRVGTAPLGALTGGAYVPPDLSDFYRELTAIWAKLHAIQDELSDIGEPCLYLYDASNNLVGMLCGLTGDMIQLASRAGSNLYINATSGTGGVSIGAGQVASTPADGEILLDPATHVKIETALIIPGS